PRQNLAGKVEREDSGRDQAASRGIIGARSIAPQDHESSAQSNAPRSVNFTAPPKSPAETPPRIGAAIFHRSNPRRIFPAPHAHRKTRRSPSRRDSERGASLRKTTNLPRRAMLRAPSISRHRQNLRPKRLHELARQFFIDRTVNEFFRRHMPIAKRDVRPLVVTRSAEHRSARPRIFRAEQCSALRPFHGTAKISGRYAPTNCRGNFSSIEPPTNFSGATCPSQNATFALSS